MAGTDPRAPLVLVVDDQRFMRQLARDWLEAAGFRVCEAADGAAGMEAFRRHRPDLVLLDVVMPVMDGFDACASLRRLPGGEHVPVLVMTGLDDEASIRRAYTVGATDFIHKPVNGVVLGHRVRYMLRASRTARALRESREKLAAAQRIAQLAYWELDPVAGELVGSEQLYAIFGRPSEHFGRCWEAFLACVHPDDRGKVRSLGERVLRDGRADGVEFRVVRPDGSERVVHQRAQVVEDHPGARPRLSGTLQDITDRRRAEEQIQFLAYYDGVTGLPNRRHLLERMKVLLAEAARRDRWVATLFVGVDRLRRISDTLGHRAADELVRAVTQRLLSVHGAAEGDGPGGSGGQGAFVGRFGEGEFVVLLGGVRSVQDVARAARDITGALRPSFRLEGQEVFATTSIGVSLFPFDGRDPDSLLRNAATAMSHARSADTSDYQFYTESMNTAALKQLLLESHLRKALERDEFVLHYQPQVDLATGELVGAEALLRWQSPDLGLVMPMEFIPLAEQTGLILPIGDWVLREACAQCRRWQEQGLGLPRIAVNVSARQFRQKDFTRQVAGALQAAGLEPRRLDSELTESTVMEDVEAAVDSLREMKRMGLRVSVDDFGTGYSSLSYLRTFPLDALKIDRSFLEGLPDDPDHAAITAAIVAMARSLKLRVIGEGVASEDQLEYLRELGCHEAQGHLLSYPVPADEFARLAGREWDPGRWARRGGGGR
ncbi:MAG: EAL domain-containing protein [Deferrisomatales bacterium]